MHFSATYVKFAMSNPTYKQGDCIRRSIISKSFVRYSCIRRSRMRMLDNKKLGMLPRVTSRYFVPGEAKLVVSILVSITDGTVTDEEMELFDMDMISRSIIYARS